MKIYLLMGLILGLRVGAAENFKGRFLGFKQRKAELGESSPYTLHYQNRKPITSLWVNSKPPVKREKSRFRRYKGEVPSFAVAEKECRRYNRIVKQTNGGGPKYIWLRNYESICGYRNPPEYIYDYYEQIAPKASSYTKVKKGKQFKRQLEFRKDRFTEYYH